MCKNACQCRMYVMYNFLFLRAGSSVCMKCQNMSRIYCKQQRPVRIRLVNITAVHVTALKTIGVNITVLNMTSVKIIALHISQPLISEQ